MSRQPIKLDQDGLSPINYYVASRVISHGIRNGVRGQGGGGYILLSDRKNDLILFLTRRPTTRKIETTVRPPGDRFQRETRIEWTAGYAATKKRDLQLCFL